MPYHGMTSKKPSPRKEPNNYGKKRANIEVEGGMEKGVDMTVSNKHYNRLVKEGRTAEASALMSIQTGALWSPQRLQEADIPTETGVHKGPFCGKEGTDEGHMFWECPKVCQNPDARIQKTNRYCDEYRRNRLSMRCYWWRGLQPQEETTPIQTPQASYEMLGSPANTYVGKKSRCIPMGQEGSFPRTHVCADVDGHGYAHNTTQTK